MTLITIFTTLIVLAVIGYVIYLLVDTTPTWGTPFYSSHVSQIKKFCPSYGYGCLEKFVEEFNKVDWERHERYETSLFAKGFDTKTEIHAAIIQFDNKGMILNRRDFRKAGKIINAKLKEIGAPDEKKNTVNWNCP